MYDLKAALIFVFVNSILFSFSVLDFLPLFSILRAFPFCGQRSHLPAAVFSFFPTICNFSVSLTVVISVSSPTNVVAPPLLREISRFFP